MGISAIFVMIVGIIIIWGGLGVSIWNAVKRSKKTS